MAKKCNYLLAAHRSDRVRNKQLQINTFYDQSFDLKLTTRYLAIIYLKIILNLGINVKTNSRKIEETKQFKLSFGISCFTNATRVM